MKHFIVNNNEIITGESLESVYIDLSILNFGYVDELTLSILKDKIEIKEIIADRPNGKPALHYV